jgi:hypothetical protein
MRHDAIAHQGEEDSIVEIPERGSALSPGGLQRTPTTAMTARDETSHSSTLQNMTVRETGDRTGYASLLGVIP